jgi:tetratricopeptide (TPR) repeat protein
MLMGGAVSCTRSGEAREAYLEGRELYASRSLEQALGRFQQAIRLDRRLRQGYVMAAKCLYYLEREREAAALLEDTLRRFPRYTDARFWMARVLYERNSLEEAEEHALAVVEQDTVHLDARLLLGDIYREQGAYEKALLNYRVVAASLDVVALSCLNMARIYVSAGRYRQALEELEFLTANAGRLNPLLLDQARGLLSEIQGTEVPHEAPER